MAEQGDPPGIGVQTVTGRPIGQNGRKPFLLHYRAEGTGVPLLLLHGNRQNLLFFSHQVSHLKDSFRTIAVDSRGHGLTPFGQEPLRLNLMACDVLALLDELHLPKVYVLGFSDGANVALNIALTAPDRVLGLVLSSPNLHPTGMKPGILHLLRFLYALTRRLSFIPWFSQHAQLLRLMVEEPDIPPEALSGLHLPVLVLSGAHDLIRESHIRLIAAAIPGAKLTILPDSGHLHLRTHHREANEVLSAFFQETLAQTNDPEPPDSTVTNEG